MKTTNNDTLIAVMAGGLFGLLVVVWAVVAGVGSLVTWVQCGERPASVGVLAVVRFFQSGGQALAVESGRCAPSTVAIGAVIAVAMVMIVAVVVSAVIVWSRWAESDGRFLRDVRSREGVAKAREVEKKAGATALMKKAATIRPSVTDPKPCDVGMRLGTSCGREVWISTEDSAMILGPPRSGKGFYVAINALMDAPGAVVTTSTRGDNVRAVWDARAKIGPVALFDPQGLTKLPSTLQWSPAQGCQSPMVASRRAQSIVGASPMGQSDSNQEWAGTATTILQYLLHAAALGDVPTPRLGQWGGSPGLAQEAVDILRAHPMATPGWADALHSELTSDPRMLPSKWMGVAGATSALMLPEVAEVLNPRPGEGLDPETFIREKGTLFLVGTKTGGGAAAPMLIALMDELAATAREMAIRMPGNRLDPPLWLILDEIANLAPWKELPTIMSDGGGVGIFTMVILQSPAQARATWGDHQAQQILDAAIITVQLGGSGNDKELERFVKLMGVRKVQQRSKTWSDSGTSTSDQAGKDDVITVAELRRLPTGTGLLLSRTSRPIVLTMARWIDRKDAAVVKESIRNFDARLAQALTSGQETVSAGSR